MYMKDFAAIDFEATNECCSSVCSVGVVIVRDGRIADSFIVLSIQFRTTIRIGTRYSVLPKTFVFPIVRESHCPYIDGRITLQKIAEPWNKRMIRIDSIQQVDDHAQYEIGLLCSAGRQSNECVPWRTRHQRTDA